MVEGLFDRIDRIAIAEDAENKGLQKGKDAEAKESLLKFVSNYMQSTHESLEKAFEVLKVSPKEQEYVRSSLSQAQP